MKRDKHTLNHYSRIIYNEDRQTQAKPLLSKINALNIYQIDIFQTLLFMYKVKNDYFF